MSLPFVNAWVSRPDASRMEWGVHLIAAVASTAMVVLAVVGVWTTYSVLPDQDIWDGLIQAYTRLQDGDWSALWAQYPEHRPVITRLLFWADQQWFHGNTVFLYACNLGFLACMAVLMSRVIVEAGGGRLAWLGWLVGGGLFLYVQAELFASAMASCFYLAYLLPLAAFYALHRASLPSAMNHSSSLALAVALALGVAAVGSQGNGLLALPLMTLMAIWMRLPVRQVAAVGLLAALCVSGYLADYSRPAGLGSLGANLIQRPGEMVLFVFGFFGSPFFWLAGKGTPGGVLAVAMGALWCLWVLTLARIIWLRSVRSSLEVALTTLLIYLAVSAVLAAGARLVYGPSTSVSSRYTLPALLGWAAVLALWVVLRKPTFSPGRRLWLVLVCAAAMVGYQIKTFEAKRLEARDPRVLQPWVSTLALELGVDDRRALQALYPDPGVLQRLAAPALAHDVGVFGMAPLKGAREILGMAKPQPLPTGTCLLQGVAIDAVATDAWVIRGWAWQVSSGGLLPADRVQPQNWPVIDANAITQGILLAMTVHAHHHPPTPPALAKGEGSGQHQHAVFFSGYVRADPQRVALRLVDPASNCMAVLKPAA